MCGVFLICTPTRVTRWDSLIDALDEEGVIYLPSRRRFSRSKIHQMLSDRSYIGEVFHKGDWHPGTQERLIDLATFLRVQKLLGGMTYRSHELVYGSGMITCAHCGGPICGERKTKQTKKEPKDYVYYFCPRAKKDKTHPQDPHQRGQARCVRPEPVQHAAIP